MSVANENYWEQTVLALRAILSDFMLSLLQFFVGDGRLPACFRALFCSLAVLRRLRTSRTDTAVEVFRCV